MIIPEMTLTPLMARKVGLSDYRSREQLRQNEIWCKRYQPKLFNVLVPPIAEVCAGLRRVEFGDANRPESDRWSVRLDDIEKTKGQIELVQFREFNLWEEPPSDLLAPSAPSPDYPIQQYSFNIKLRHDRHAPMKRSAWTQMIRDSERLGYLDTTIDMGLVPVALGDISMLYHRQDAVRRGRRLQKITAYAVEPYDISSLQSFASLAGSSIKYLVLCANFSAGCTDLSIIDIPGLITAIRTNTPNLSRLELAVNGIETAEVTSKSMLSADLSVSGNIEYLRLHTAPSSRDSLHLNRGSLASMHPHGHH